MSFQSRTLQYGLILGFMAILIAIPISQIALEITRGQPVQCTDLLRCVPSKENLRRFEQTLEDSWWGQEQVRPNMQRLIFWTFGSFGAKAIRGRDDWVFYRPGVKYLTDRPGLETDDSESLWVRQSSGDTCRNSVVRAITRFRDQLVKRDIELLVVPIPGKASVYPDFLTRRVDTTSHDFRSPTEELLDDLNEHGITTVDLFSVFRLARKQSHVENVGDVTYYLENDTHWTPAGAELAANAVADTIKQLGWIPDQLYEYSRTTVRVRRSGDILQMTQIPGLAQSFASEVVDCRQIIDPFIDGPMVPRADARNGSYMNEHLIDTPMESRFLLLGDSFSRIYQIAEPASLGQVVHSTDSAVEASVRGNQPQPLADQNATTGHETNRKQLLPGSAGFPSLLADALKTPVDYLVSDGGAATDVRQRLSVYPEILENKRFIIWEFTERDIQLGSRGWQEIPLPPGRNTLQANSGLSENEPNPPIR